MDNKPINYLLIFSLLLFLSSFLLHPVTAITQDLGRHLKMGEIILNLGQVPKTNLFSYTYPDFPFVNHHWLSEVIFFLIYQLGGFNLLIILKTLLIVFSLALILVFIQRKADPLFTGFVSLFYLPLLQERTEVRPEVFSFLLFSFYLVILNLGKERKTRLLWFLPVIQLLWVNLHIYFFLGPVLFFFFVISQLITPEKRSGKDTSGVSELTPPRWRRKELAFIGLLILLTNLLNPNGLKGALFPLNVFKNYGYEIVENKSPFFLEKLMPNPLINYFKISLLLLVLSFILNYKNLELFSFLSASFFSLMAIVAIRNFPIFVLGTLPIAAENLTKVFLPFLERLPAESRILREKAGFIQDDPGKKDKIKQRWYYLIILFFSCFFLYQAFGFVTGNNWKNSSKTFGFGVEKGAKEATDFVLVNKIKGPVFNNFDVGSYLDFRLYPEKVFVDGRPEAYPVSFFKNVYIPMQNEQKDWEKWSQYYKINYIFFSHTDITPWAQTFLKRIVNDKNWIMVYLDDYVVVLVKNDKLNQEIIQKFSLNQENAAEKTFLSGKKEPLYYLRMARFFNIITWQKQAQEAYQQSRILENF